MLARMVPANPTRCLRDRATYVTLAALGKNKLQWGAAGQPIVLSGCRSLIVV